MKSAIRNFVADHRRDTHRELKIRAMPLSDTDIELLMKFQRQVRTPSTGGARNYLLLNVLCEIPQRYWTLDEVAKTGPREM